MPVSEWPRAKSLSRCKGEAKNDVDVDVISPSSGITIWEKKSIYNCFKLICKMKHFKISKLYWSYFVPCFLYFWSIIVKNWTIFVFSPCELLCKSKASALEVCVIIRGLFWTSDDGTWVEILEKYGLKNVRTHLSTLFLVVCKKGIIQNKLDWILLVSYICTFIAQMWELSLNFDFHVKSITLQ